MMLCKSKKVQAFWYLNVCFAVFYIGFAALNELLNTYTGTPLLTKSLQTATSLLD